MKIYSPICYYYDGFDKYLCETNSSLIDFSKSHNFINKEIYFNCDNYKNNENKFRHYSFGNVNELHFNHNQNNKDNNENYKIDFRIPFNYQTEAFGICVRKDKMNMEERELYLNQYISGINNDLIRTPKFSKKKRLRAKNDSGNLKTCPTTNS